MLRQIVSIITLGSYLTTLAGCTTSRPLARDVGVNQPQRQKIEVWTTDGLRYVLSNWVRNDSGDVTGMGLCWDRGSSRSFHGTIPAKDIVSASISRIHAGKTVLLALGSLGGAAVLALIAFSVAILSAYD